MQFTKYCSKCFNCLTVNLPKWNASSVIKRAFSTTAVSQQDTESAPKIRDEISDIPLLSGPRALPIITSREIKFPHLYREPKQAWLESLSQTEDEKLGIIDLHPEIFGAYPRIDILHRNVKWQRDYKRINYDATPTRGELAGSTRKIYPQKKLGKARHSDRKAPIFTHGAKAIGPRGPKSYFYMLNPSLRVQGLCIALSVKYAQGYLQIVENLEIPTDDPQFLKDISNTRYWGFSCLFVDDTDIMPKNIAVAVNDLPSYNLMPVYGLNVFSMLKHETLVLTLAAVEKIEEKLLYHLHKTKHNKRFSMKERYELL